MIKLLDSLVTDNPFLSIALGTVVFGLLVNLVTPIIQRSFGVVREGASSARQAISATQKKAITPKKDN